MTRKPFDFQSVASAIGLVVFVVAAIFGSALQ